MPRFAIRSLTLGLLVALLSACAALQTQLERPNIGLVDLDLQQVGLLEQRFVITLNVQNPNGIAIPVRGMSYALQIAGQDFARGVSPQSFTVPAYGEQRVQVEMSTNMLSALRQVQTLLKGSTDQVNYKLAGKLDVDVLGGVTLPFENTGEFKLTL